MEIPRSVLSGINLGSTVAQRRVKPSAVVVLPPIFNDRAGVLQVQEPVAVEALIPEPAVETLNVGILHRLARLDEHEPHIVDLAHS